MIDEHSFDTHSGELRLRDGTIQKLRPQTAAVLAILSDSRGQVVTKDRLMQEVWPDTHVTDDSLVQCISEIRKALGSEAGSLLVTVPRKGYRLDTGRSRTRWRPFAFRRIRLATVLLFLLLISAFAGWWSTRSQPPAGPITIAVMPFLNIGGEPEQDYLSGGVTEDLIINLSKISDLRVFARGTTAGLAGQGHDLLYVAERLGADFVLEGSVGRRGERLRLTASLADGKSGANVWAENYDRTTSDMFALQDEVIGQIVRVLAVRLSRAERKRLGVHGTKSIEAHDAYLRGRELVNLYTRETNLEAEAALREALDHDPNFALAHAHLAQAYSFRVEFRWSNDPEGDARRALEEAERAVELDPELPYAHFSLGRILTRNYAVDTPRAIAAYNKAVELDPNYVDAYVFLAFIHIFNGQAEKAMPLVAKGYDLNPVPPYWYYLTEGMAEFFFGNFESAEKALITARDQSPTAPAPYRMLIATYGELGDTDEAEWMAAEYEALGRSATISDIMETTSMQDPKYRDRLATGLEKAGLPGG